MNLKRFGAVVIAVLALGAVMASSAFAVATTEVKPWRTGTTEAGVKEIAATKSEQVTATATEAFVLKTKIGETTLELKSSELGCLSCTIFNESGGAKGKGKIEFKNVSVVKPTTCKVKENKILTNALKVDATYMIGTRALQQFLPETGEAFTTITLEKSGEAACPISGGQIVKGSVFSEAVNKTTVYKQEQVNVFTPLINSEAGGKLRVGEELAELTGKGKFVDKGEGGTETRFFGVG